MNKSKTKSKSKASARQPAKGCRRPSSCSAWIARDSTPIGGKYAMCLFEGKPEISNAGFWTYPKDKYGGRWPLTLPIFVNIGDRMKITITETLNEPVQPRKAGEKTTPEKVTDK